MSGTAQLGNEASNLTDNLSYGSAQDGETMAKEWLERNNRSFGLFVNGHLDRPEGRSTLEVKKPATDEVLATILDATQEDVANAVASSKEAFESWSNLPPHVRAGHLYSIARNLQKHQSLLAVLEAMDSGKPSRETRGVDVPAVIRQFYHHAGWAEITNEEMRGWKPFGVTAVLPHWTFPLLQLASHVAPALAMGNTVVIMPSVETSLTALLLAEVCAKAGLPSGVVNVVTGRSANLLVSHPGVAKVAFVGSVKDGVWVRQAAAGGNKNLSLELGERCPVLIFEDADMDSAVEGIVEAAFFNSGQSNYAGTRLLIQAAVYNQVIDKLKARMAKLTIGDNMDKNNDQGPLISAENAEILKRLVADAEKNGAEVFKSCSPPSNKPNFFPPTLVTNAQTCSDIYIEQYYGPLVVAVPFRTEKEGITIANHSVFGTAASVWTENVNVALEVAVLLEANTVWINSHNLFDAAAGIGGTKGSGFGSNGGKEGLYAYVQPSWQNWSTPTVSDDDLKKFGSTSGSDPMPSAGVPDGAAGDSPSVDKTYKLFYGGGQKRPDGGSSLPVRGPAGEILAYIPEGGRKDIRNAVEVAVKAAGSWCRKEGHGRAQIMYYIAENLQSRKEEFTKLLSSGGQTEADACKEIDVSIQRLFYWAAYCDKFGGSVQETNLYGLTVKRNESLGVIGIVCPDKFPFLGFISLIAPAIARGNAVIAVPSQKFPLAALLFHQVLETSDLPGGVVNIITGNKDGLTTHLAQHHEVSSVWYFGSQTGSKFVESAWGGNIKRTWVNYGVERDFMSAEQGQGEEFLHRATATKNIWIPMGDIFAN